MGGIGKTILAQALCHDPQVQEHFCDGILWATLGQQPDILSLLQGWILALGDYDYKPTTIKSASSHLNSLLYDKAVLLIIDDGWKVGDVEPFRVGSSNCQVIITTRLADIAEEVRAQLYSLDLMSEDQSLLLLSNRLDRELAEEETAAAKKLAKAVGYLPIALDLAAARVAREKSWSELNSALTAEIVRLEVLEGIRRRRKKETLLEASFNLSLNFLREDFPEAWESFVWLGVLPEDVSIAAPMVATLWQVEVAEAADRLELFWNDALLLPSVSVRIGTEEWASYRVHDLLHDLAIKWLTTKDSPGLGLTIPEAHNTLLERYRNKLDDEKWYKIVDDGYICDRLTWHMEKAEAFNAIHQLLREETESGQHGWYSKCENLGKTTIFVGDVARAWKLTEIKYERNSNKIIGLLFRYAIITSSLNTMSANIPPELITVLVEKKYWSPEQGLVYLRLTKSLLDRVKASMRLSLSFPEFWLEAYATATNIKNTLERIEALIIIAINRSEIWLEVLVTVQNLENEYDRADMLRCIALHLPENLTPQALSIANTIEDLYVRESTIYSFEKTSPKNLLAVIRKIHNDYRYEDEYRYKEYFIKIITHNLPCIAENLNLMSAILEITWTINTQSSQIEILSLLAPYLPKKLTLTVLDIARISKNKYFRVKVMSLFVKDMPEMLSEILKIIKYIDNQSYWVEILSSIATYLPKYLILELLEAVRNIQDEFYLRKVLINLTPYLPKTLTLELLEIIRAIDNEVYRADFLASFVPHIPEIFLEVLQTIKAIDNEYKQGDFLQNGFLEQENVLEYWVGEIGNVPKGNTIDRALWEQQNPTDRKVLFAFIFILFLISSIIKQVF
ncbi:MAG: NB-ARC domain-containing protein, partial [Cyanobacteria bacterium P01_F01_bin.143]